MANLNANQFVPDYVVPPGEILEDYLESYGMSQVELADRLGFTTKTVNEIVKGKAPITAETSIKLERVFSRPAHFWNNLERQYQEDLARIAEQERLNKHLDWLARVPVSAMAKLGFIEKFKGKVEQLNEVLRFFGVASPDQWETVWEQHQVAYRQQAKNFDACAIAVSAWLREGEIKAQQIDRPDFNKQHFQEILGVVRELTTEPPEVFQPRLIALCAQAGVAVVFVPDLPKTGVSGATRWVGGKPVIQLSLRYKWNDRLWFTFFHEAGHIIKHGKKAIFLEGNGMGGDKEEEADAFARNILIPPADYKVFRSTTRPTLGEVESFAAHIGIAAGIVVGRLQHDGILPMNTGNGLKVRYKWVIDN